MGSQDGPAVPSSRAVSRLSLERLYRKRALDRENQRILRQKNKARLTELELQVQQLEAKLQECEVDKQRQTDQARNANSLINAVIASLQSLQVSLGDTHQLQDQHQQHQNQLQLPGSFLSAGTAAQLATAAANLTSQPAATTALDPPSMPSMPSSSPDSVGSQLGHEDGNFANTTTTSLRAPSYDPSPPPSITLDHPPIYHTSGGPPEPSLLVQSFVPPHQHQHQHGTALGLGGLNGHAALERLDRLDLWSSGASVNLMGVSAADMLGSSVDACMTFPSSEFSLDVDLLTRGLSAVADSPEAPPTDDSSILVSDTGGGTDDFGTAGAGARSGGVVAGDGRADAGAGTAGAGGGASGDVLGGNAADGFADRASASPRTRFLLDNFHSLQTYSPAIMEGRRQANKLRNVSPLWIFTPPYSPPTSPVDELVDGLVRHWKALHRSSSGPYWQAGPGRPAGQTGCVVPGADDSPGPDVRRPRHPLPPSQMLAMDDGGTADPAATAGAPPSTSSVLPPMPMDATAAAVVAATRDDANTDEFKHANFPSISSLLNPVLYESDKPIASTIARHVALMTTAYSAPEKVALVYVICLLIRWLISPTQQHYESIPPFFRPSATQLLVPHPFWVDTLGWPEARDRIIRHMDFTSYDHFGDVLVRTFRIGWPYRFEGIFEGSPERGFVMSKAFVQHVCNPVNWSVNMDVINAYPFLDGAMNVRGRPPVSF